MHGWQGLVRIVLFLTFLLFESVVSRLFLDSVDVLLDLELLLKNV